MATAIARPVSLSDLSEAEFSKLTPYQLAALAGKKIIHPGGRFSTRRVFKAAQFEAGQRVLEVGVGVGHAAVRMAREFGVHVTGIDIDPQMLCRAHENVAKAGLTDRIDIQNVNVERLPYPDNHFDRVVVESVTMFTDMERSASEILRVLKPGGILVDHEFAWSRPPTPSRSARFAAMFGTGRCELPGFWRELYTRHGLDGARTMTGPVLNFTPPGILIDEGPMGLVFLGRTLMHWRAAKFFFGFVFRINSLAPTLRYVIVTGRKP